MAKCEFCGKGVTFGIKVSQNMEAQCKASKGSCEGYSLPRICLLQMPPFRKSRTCVRYKNIAFLYVCEKDSGVFR